MSDLTYKSPEKPSRPFRSGDRVEVLDLNHKVLSVVRVTHNDGDVHTDCGRCWTQSGWWIGDDEAWPFPSIRHATTDASTKGDGK